MNINPVQPSLSATNLNIATLGGPAQAGFNEFTPLFQKNQTRVDLTLQAGNFNTGAGEAVVSGVYDKLSFSAGLMSYETDGWRDNNGVEQDLGNVFIQYAVNEKVNLQFEYFDKESTEGDLAFNFDPDSFVQDKNTKRDQSGARFGLRVNPTLASTILVSYIDTDNQEIQHESDFLAPAVFVFGPDPDLVDFFQLLDFEFDDDLNVDAEQLEAQYIYDVEKHNLIIGLSDNENKKTEDGVFSILSQDGSDIFLSFSPSSVLSTPFTLNEEVDHTRSYIYYNNTASEQVSFTLGASRDDYAESIIEVEETNPKLGLQWSATSEFTVRAAAFQTVKPLLANNRTLEPSQISGFNQFYDDVNGTISSKAGLAFDWNVMPNLYITASFTKRELDVPLFDVTSNAAIIEEREEVLNNLSLYWMPSNEWSVTAEIIYDTFQNNEGPAALSFDDPLKVDTLSFPIGASYFNPNGFFASVKGTHVDQEVVRSLFSSKASGKDDFFIVDLSAGYRLNKRRGILSLGILNLFDEEFMYQDDSYREQSSAATTGPYFPERMIMGQVVFNF